MRELKRWLLRKGFTDLDPDSVGHLTSRPKVELYNFLLKFKRKPKTLTGKITGKHDDSNSDN